MSRPLRKIVRSIVAAALGLAALPPLAAAETAAPLPRSNYAIRSACAAPAPDRGACFADQLVPVTAAAQRHRRPLGMVGPALSAQPAVPSPTSGAMGLRPQDLHGAYSLPTEAPGPPTVAVIDAYNDPAAEADLKTYSEPFGLPECTAASGCFKQVSQKAGLALPFPKTVKELETASKSASKAEREEAKEAIGWGVEISLDIESVHAICTNCRILLVEAQSTSVNDLSEGVERAEELGAQEISNSWGAPEEGIPSFVADELPYYDPGTVITASAGDDGYRNWYRKELRFTSFPASSSSVVAVGGTHLNVVDERWASETVWNGSGAGGGGCSVVFATPPWQLQAANWPAVGCSGRSVSDVSAVADPYTGVVIRDTDFPGKECRTPYIEKEGEPTKFLASWCTYGGTSLASPVIASVFALAGGAQGRAEPAQTLYETERNAPSLLHDVTSGSNGECNAGFNSEGIAQCSPAQEAAASCESKLACLAAPGYDGPSGVGTPNGTLGFTPGQVEHHAETARTTGSQPAAASSAPPTVVAPDPPPAVELSGVSLKALATLARHPTTANVAFAFSSNQATRLLVTLARLVRSHGRSRWVTVVTPATIAIAAGRNVKRLPGRRRLARGIYRLTLRPPTGVAHSIVFRIG
jgi:Subtilase family